MVLKILSCIDTIAISKLYKIGHYALCKRLFEGGSIEAKERRVLKGLKNP